MWHTASARIEVAGSADGDKELQGAPEAKQDEDDGDEEEACLHTHHTWLQHSVANLTPSL